MHSVIGHLIDNAQQATPDDGHVSITMAVAGDYLQIKIVDNGEGMSQSFIEQKLFKPFETTKGNAGMGVGVYEAKSFVEELNGHIEVESNIGEGTTFTLSLPVRN